MSKKKIKCTNCDEKFRPFQVVVSYKNLPYCMHCFRNIIIQEHMEAYDNDFVLEVEVNHFYWHKREDLPKLFSVYDGRKDCDSVFDDEIPY